MVALFDKLSRAIKTHKTRHALAPRAYNNILRQDASALLSLPFEIILEIFSCLEFKHLHRFRLTCHTADHLVNSPQFLDSWIKSDRHRLPTAHFRLLYPVTSERLTLSWIATQYKRFLTAERFRNTLTVFLSQHVKIRHVLEGILENWWRIEDRLLETLLTIQHYLENVSALWLRLPTSRLQDDRDDNFTVRFRRHEERIFSAYTSQMIQDAHDLWHLLCWTNRRLLRDGSLFDLFRDTMSLSRRNAGNPDELFRLYLVHTNLQGLNQVFNHPSLRSRKKHIFRTLTLLNPSQTRLFQKHWKVHTTAPTSPTKMEAWAAFQFPLGWHSLWMTVAPKVMIERGLMQREELLENVAQLEAGPKAIHHSTDIAGHCTMQIWFPPRLHQILLQHQMNFQALQQQQAQQQQPQVPTVLAQMQSQANQPYPSNNNGGAVGNHDDDDEGGGNNDSSN